MEAKDKHTRVSLEASWKERVGDYLLNDRMQGLANFLRHRKAAGVCIYPPASDIFAALNSTPFTKVKVVILGQDPYHGTGQAHGLCFSVRHGVVIPPSLHNIYRELHDDLGIPCPNHGCLADWARQGVLLLNSVLTVEHGRAGSHTGKGWEEFTDHIMVTLNHECNGLVFLLWGSYAQRKGTMIDRKKHKVLKAPHPSPLSAYRGFLGCKHFSATNAYLRRFGHTPIDWSLS